MTLIVNITGGKNIEQGQQVTLRATVTDADGNTPPGTLQYAWSASRGAFIGATNEASVVYHADFTGTGDIQATITCNVTLPANPNPTVASGSLTAMTALGITGQLLNMYINPTNDVLDAVQTQIYNEATQTLAAGSDDDLSSVLHIDRIQWNDATGRFIMNNNGTGDLGAFWATNTAQSVFIIFGDGTVHELTNSDYAASGARWTQWDITDSNIVQKLVDLSSTSTLLVGVGDTGSIGFAEETGSDTETLTASPPRPLSIEAIDEQFIPLGTTDYDLVIDITGNPDTVEATGHMEGFNYDYDVANAQLHIRAAEATRLIAGVFWTVKITKGAQTLTADIAYNVVKAPPIFETLSMLHLYKDVPINIDILIQNIPNLIVPNARLLGLKSELQAYGMNIKEQLPADAHLTVNEGDISMIVPSETGGTSEMHEYPYEIESGTPPAIVSPNWQPKGNYGTLTFADVNHALGYEWTLETGDAAVWNFFNSTRAVINPSEVEVTPGNLNVTLKFPNVAGASSYEYRLEGENYERDWTRFVGTFANGMITTIIPDLPEGETLMLRVRVASPWIGPAISIQVTGGRLAFVMHNDSGNSYLYVFHTGVPNGATATRIKRILLPTTFTGPDKGGLAVDGNDVYIINVEGRIGEEALYKFDWTAVDDGDRVTNARRNPLGGSFHSNARCNGMGIRGDELYVSLWNGSNVEWPSGISVVGKDQVDGASLLPTRSSADLLINNHSGISLSDTTLFLINRTVVTVALYDADFVDGQTLRASQLIRLISTPSNVGSTVRGHSVIGEAEKIYLLVSSEELVRFESDGTRFSGFSVYKEVWRISLPSGLTDSFRVDIAK